MTLISVTGGDRFTLKHYDLRHLADLEVALDELEGVLTGEAPRPPDSRTYTHLDNTLLGGRVREDFPNGNLAGAALRTLESLDADQDLGAGTERVQAAAVLLAAGDLARLDEALALARRDWRDLLVGGTARR